jgi:hypothetical protein
VVVVRVPNYYVIDEVSVLAKDVSPLKRRVPGRLWPGV